ncbi:42369_t:CDS:2, partial [Gigaspora margarita]
YINAVDPFNPSIIYESIPSAPQNILRPQHDARFLNIIILGGDGSYIKNNNNNSDDDRLCSAGFWTIYNPINFYDIGIIDVENEDFSPRSAIRNTDDQYKELIIVDGVPVFSHGVHICKSGITSHFTCGYVQGLNGIYSTGDHFALEVIITSTDVEGGDSGGPVLSFVSPQDLFSVVVHGIIITRGSSAQSIDTIFRVIKENTGLDLTLYH